MSNDDINTLIITDNENVAVQIASTLGHYNRDVFGRNQSINLYTVRRSPHIYRVLNVGSHLMKYSYSGSLPRIKKDMDIALDTKKALKMQVRKVEHNHEIVQMLRFLLPNTDRIVIASKNDPYGDLVGVEMKYLLKKYRLDIPMFRMNYNTLYEDEIRDSLNSINVINDIKADGIEVYSLLNYKSSTVLSRLFTAMGRDIQNSIGYININPVQMAICGLVYNRMNEISQFNEYSKSNINVTLRNSNDAIFNVSSKMEYSDKDESTKHLINTKDEDFASVIGCKTNDIIVPPPKPLIIPSLVQECSDHLALLPDEVIRGCNRLYMRKFVSLPRAMDVEYSRNIDIDSILYELSKESSPYKEYAEELIQNGIRVDEFDINTNSCPIVPLRLLTRSEKRVNKLVRMHDLICRYFLASISGPLKYVDTEIDVQIGNQEYTGHVTNVIDHGWSQCYPWYNVDSCIESNIPMVGETLEVDRVSLTDVPLDIPSPLKIGDLYHTMSDRSNMIANSIPGNLKKLLDNNIIQISHRQNITLTPFGWDFVKCINDFAPALLSSQTIGFFNKLGQDVMNGKVSKGSALKQGENIIQMVFDSIYSNKKMIVSRLGEVYKDIEDYTIDIDTCPSCGHKRIVRIYEKSDGKVRRFVGCTNFPECKESRSIPASGRIQVMDDVCPKSGETVLRILPDNNKPYTWALGIGPCFACDRKNKCDKGKKK